jgi:cytochrome c peroxidase
MMRLRSTTVECTTRTISGSPRSSRPGATAAGRAADLKAQAGGPIANPGEMGFSHTLAIGILESIPA